MLVSFASRWVSTATKTSGGLRRSLATSRAVSAVGRVRHVSCLGLDTRIYLHQSKDRCLWLNESRRSLASGLGLAGDELRKRRLEFQDNFAEARMCIADTEESVDTVYFSDDAEDAEEAVKICMETYERLLEDMNDEDRGQFQRENSQKMRQLQEELKHIITSANEDH